MMFPILQFACWAEANGCHWADLIQRKKGKEKVGDIYPRAFKVFQWDELPASEVWFVANNFVKVSMHMRDFYCHNVVMWACAMIRCSKLVFTGSNSKMGTRPKGHPKRKTGKQ
jgi:hypothetical protein